MTHLSVNLNKMALLRNSRNINVPDVAVMGRRCLVAGAFGLTIHPRPDQRHAKYSDIQELHQVVQEFPDRELNIEGYPTELFLQHVINAKPHQCTLVPDEPGQLTSDHGWLVAKNKDLLSRVLSSLREAGIRSSLFMDVDNTEEYKLAKELGADRIELYTEPYALAFGTVEQDSVVAAYAQASQVAIDVGLEVNAGHDLNLLNLGALCKAATIVEVSIGHALTVECFDYGLEGTIQRYLNVLSEAAEA
ncbi:MAG: pyridoxine 5'-phosphate synthase [Deltaproteobacteria bacterium]|nr:MAG: pyridoxine 5'-phosphate synthase [Deltaproteobacteria bacterium]